MTFMVVPIDAAMLKEMNCNSLSVSTTLMLSFILWLEVERFVPNGGVLAQACYPWACASPHYNPY